MMVFFVTIMYTSRLLVLLYIFEDIYLYAYGRIKTGKLHIRLNINIDTEKSNSSSIVAILLHSTDEIKISNLQLIILLDSNNGIIGSITDVVFYKKK